MRLDKDHAVLQRKLEHLERQNLLRNATTHNDTKTIRRSGSTLKKTRFHQDSPSIMNGPPSAGLPSKKERRKMTVLEQWVEIAKGPDGKTITTLHPPNDVLIQRRHKIWPAPELVYRRLHFVGGIPEEYSWSTSDLVIRTAGGMGLQRMTIDTWLKLIEKEDADGKGHLLPTHNLPRPQERGGCDCLVCAKNQKILDRASDK